MSVLDTIDTTLTLEWAQTRTVATLVHLGARTATVTALRTPDVGVECFLRLEGDSPADTIAIDGVCIASRDGEWGEFEADVAIARVGTTTSATALRDFIEQHEIAKGGTVAVGKNRDTPDIKRFVYTLPHPGVALPATRGSEPRAMALETPRVGRTLPLEPVRPPEPTTQSVSTFAPRLPSAPVADVQSHRLPTPPPMPGIEMGDVDAELRDMLDMLDQRVGRMTSEERDAESPSPIVRLQPEMIADSPNDTAVNPISGATDDEGPILVETVELSDSQPRPVMTVPQARAASKKGLVARIFGFGEKGKPGESAAVADPRPQTQQEPGPPPDPMAVWDRPVRQPQSGRGMVSGSLVAVQQLFSVDQAVRTERPVTFESGKKKRQGTVLRLSESKLRVRAPVMPTPYERIAITLPAPHGTKDTVVIRCEVTRIRAADSEGGEQSFDAKLTGANDPATMARLRLLMTEMQPILGEGP